MQEKKKVFSEEFDFDFQDLAGQEENKTPAAAKSNGKLVRIEERSLIEDEMNDKFDEDLDFEAISGKKDRVRTKKQNGKRSKEDENDEFFETISKKSRSQSYNCFEDMKISKPLTKALTKMGLTEPTPIQSAAIPIALQGRDICACAVTGSGKTIAFMLPTLERLVYKPKFPQVTRVLVLTPTRELAVQICKVTRDLSQFTSINTCLCAGGFDIKSQEASLRLGPDVVVATPGRLIDHLHNTPSFNLHTVEVLILDEADRMLDEHFAEQLKEIMRMCAHTRQTMLFSATMTDRIEDLVNVSLKKPMKIFISENVDITPRLRQEFVRLRDPSDKNRESILMALIQRKFNERVIVFVRTKSDCHRLCMLLNCLNLKAAELHGGLTQTQRIEKLTSFQEAQIDILVATDLAARGLDIQNVQTVINFTMPMSYKNYVHRVGRTARAGESGRSVSLVSESDRWLLKEIVKSSKEPVKCRVVPQEVIEYYRNKWDDLKRQVSEELKKEREDKMLESMEKDIGIAKNKISRLDGSENDVRPKRTWLENVDYKTGQLKSEMKKQKRESKVKSKESNRTEKRGGGGGGGGGFKRQRRN